MTKPKIGFYGNRSTRGPRNKSVSKMAIYQQNHSSTTWGVAEVVPFWELESRFSLFLGPALVRKHDNEQVSSFASPTNSSRQARTTP